MRWAITVLFSGLIFLVGCEIDKIPVTTSSEEALKDFITGRDLIEKIRQQEAQPYLEKAISEDPDFALAHLYLAFTQTSKQSQLEGIAKAKSLIDKVSEGERLCILAFDANIYGYGKKQEAYLQALVENYPNDEHALNFLGSYYSEQHELEKAIVYFKRAIQSNPNHPNSYNLIGYAYRYMNNYPAAEESFKKYIKLNPDDPNPYDSYAELLLKMGEFEVSIETYEKALEMDPNFAPSHFGIASNLIYLREYNKARNQLKRLSRIAINDAQRRTAILGCAVVYIAEGDFETGLTEIDKLDALAASISDTVAIVQNQFLKASVLLEFGKLDDSRDKLILANKIIDSANFSDDLRNNFQRRYLYNLTRLMVEKSQINQAKKYAGELSEVLKKNDNPILMTYNHSLSGIIALAEKDYDRAITKLNQSNLEDPYNQYRLAMAYQAKGEKESAIEKYEEVLKYNGLVGIVYVIIRQRAEQQLIRLKAFDS
jgi:tetratricopeptide (TPR) repeat protein